MPTDTTHRSVTGEPSPTRHNYLAKALQVTLLASIICWANFAPFPNPLRATTWIIRPDGSGDAPTIQAGVDSAAAGDTVLVTAGTYPQIYPDETGDYSAVQMKSGVVLLSADGPEQTIIDVDTSLVTRGVTLLDCDVGTVVEGFTLSNGDAFTGAGAYIDGGAPVIRGNIFLTSSGGTGSAMSITNGATPRVIDNRFDRNAACCGVGGAILSDGASPEIRRNIFIGSSGFGGGAVAFLESSGIIAENEFIANTGTNGGGLFVQGGNVDVLDNLFFANHATTEGGAAAFTSSAGTRFIGNVVTGNTADGNGGGLVFQGLSPQVARTTIVGNSATNGGGVYIYESASPTLVNTILRNDFAYSGPEIYVDGLGGLDISYSNVEGGWTGEGNIDADPSFVYPARRDYRLLWGSPCIDSGHPGLLDPDGSRSDMGAFAFDQSGPVTIYLTPDTTGIAAPGELGVTYTLINIEPDPRTFYLESAVILPDGNPYAGNPLVGPLEITLPGGRNAQRHVVHAVPGTAPAGRYYYKGWAGLSTGRILDNDHFDFTVIPE